MGVTDHMLPGFTARALPKAIYRDHDKDYTQPDGTAVNSRQDWTEKCGARGTTHCGSDHYQDCPIPVSQCYDHEDGILTNVVETRIFLVDVEGHTQNEEVQTISWDKRATYLYKYDCHDKAGNRAEQVVFALILDDQDAPEISVCNGVAETVEAADPNWGLCQETSAIDCIDGMVPVTCTVQDLTFAGDETNSTCVSHGTQAECAACITTSICDHHDHDHAAVAKRYLVSYEAEDSAGVYGRSSHNNVAAARKAILIEDTTAPEIFKNGVDWGYWECNRLANLHNATDTALHEHGSTTGTTGTDTGDWSDETGPKYLKPYDDAGAYAVDALDTATCGSHDLEVNTSYNDVDSSIVGNYTVEYDATDYSGNVALTATRHVQVVDTQPCHTRLVGDCLITLTHGVNTDENSDEFNLKGEEGAIATDDCDPAFPMTLMPHGGHADRLNPDGYAAADHTNTTADVCVGLADDVAGCAIHWNRPFDIKQMGTYVKTYQAKDANNNYCNPVERTWVIEDAGKPVLWLQGDTPETYEASRDIEYTDKGATCTDTIDGSLSHAVEVSGQVVNMRVPATYHIRYDCQDLAGNQALEVTRKIIVRDTLCPTITMLGSEVNYVEAGFPYNDAGATATDDLDGDITATIFKSGDTVDTSAAFYALRSCAQIKQSQLDIDTPATDIGNGKYFITTFNSDESEYKRVAVWCDMSMPDESGKVVANTFLFVDQDVSVNPWAVPAVNTAVCAAHDMTLYKPDCAGASVSTATDFALKSHVEDELSKVASDYGLGLTGCTAQTAVTSYLCTTKDSPAIVDYERVSLHLHDFQTGEAQDQTVHNERGTLSGHHGSGNNTTPDFTVSTYPNFIVNDRVHDRHQHTSSAVAQKIAAEVGKYLIFYHVQDLAENFECATLKRTVIVRDTLSPVIALHYNKKLIQVSGTGEYGNHSNHFEVHNHATQTNPGGDAVPVSTSVGNPAHGFPGGAPTDGNPAGWAPNPFLKDLTLMAEESKTSGINGWVLGAAASSVAGLALLASSQRKAVVTTVPV